jgi:hypothetical protein
VASDRASLSRPAYACVERRILRRIPDLAYKVTAGDIDAADVIQVEADVVLRLVRNQTVTPVGRAARLHVQPGGMRL